MHKQLSVAVVTYNHGRYIGPCIESIVSQAVDFPYELVIGDDCSTDGTTEIIKKYASEYSQIIRPIFHARNVGGERNYIDVISACEGEYIAYTDGDDLMLPGKLQKQVDFLNAHRECAIVCHNLRVFDDETGNTLYLFNRNYKKPVSGIEDLIKYGTFFGHSSKMFRRSSLPDQGIEATGMYVGDWLYHIQNASKGSIGYIDEVLGEYRKHGGAITNFNINTIDSRIKGQEYTLRKAAEYVKDETTINLGYTKIYYDAALYCLLRRHFAEFVHYVDKSAERGLFFDEQHRFIFRLRHFPRILLMLRVAKRLIPKRNA